MGLRVNVYRAAGRDCTNGGVSSKYDTLTVVNADGPFDPSDDAPAAKLLIGPYDTIRLVPVELDEQNVWVMFGGNLASTSDSRFGEAIEKLGGDRFAAAVNIFDRVE